MIDDKEGVMNGDKEGVLQPVPNSIKLTALLLLVLLIAVVSWLLSDDNDEQIEAAASRLIDIENATADSEAVSQTSNPLASTQSFEPVQTDSYLPAQQTRVKNTEKLSQLTEKLEQLINDNTIRQDGQDQLIENLQSQVTSQNLQIKQLQENLKARQVATARQIKKSKPKKRYRSIKVPFTLVSIDRWGTDLYAVLRLSGQLHELTQGQSVKGWYLDSFNQQKQSVYFKNKYGTRRELFIQS